MIIRCKIYQQKMCIIGKYFGNQSKKWEAIPCFPTNI